MPKLIMLLPVILLLSACKTVQYSNPDEYPGRKVIIGEGGGFTGQTTKIVVLENGQYFSQTVFPQSSTSIGTLKKKDAKEIFSRFDELNFTTIDFIHPGNMTYFIMFQDTATNHEVKWGDSGFTPPENVLKYYQFLRDKLK